MDPSAGAVGPDFLFPDGDVGLDGVDDETGGGEGFVAMGAGDGDEDGGFGEGDAAGAVEDDLLDDGPLGAGGLGEGLQLGEGHFEVGFVVEGEEVVALGVFFSAGGAKEEADAAGVWGGDEVEGFGGGEGSGEDVDPVFHGS